MRPAFLFLSLFALLAARAAEPFEIKDGDRVLLLGDTLLERENSYGTLELRMHEQFPDRKFSVRNLSWAGETPRGISRASFDPPEKGFERLKEQIALVKPTVVFLGFGMAASLQEMTDRSRDWTLNPDPARYGAEPMSARRFKKELGELMVAITDASGSAGASPAVPGAPAGNTSRAGRPSGESSARAPKTAGEAPALPGGIRVPGVGGAGGVRFVLLSPIRHEDLRATRPGLPDPAAHNALLVQYSKAIEELAKERGARFVSLASIRAQDDPKEFRETTNGIHLTEHAYTFLQDRVAEQLGAGGLAAQTPFRKRFADLLEYGEAMKPLRAAILRKNALWFHRTRPANETYLTGFRKHEQGQNAKEIPEFDPLVEQADAEIDRLKRAPKSASAAPEANRGTQTASNAALPRPEGALTPPEGVRRPEEGALQAPEGARQPPEGLPIPAFDLGENLEISLWAANPLLVKPTQMNWDALGRLWVCGTAHYPQIAPGEIEKDQIFILEDTDRDGKADKSTPFAGGMLMPTGIVPDLSFNAEAAEGAEERRGNKNQKTSATSASSANSALKKTRDGCYVGASTELLHFADTDGDGHADTRRIVFSGFGTEDTHHTVHTLKWGPDGRLYFNQSVYIHSHLETPYGMVRLNAGGVFAYDPRTERVEVFSKGLWNPWGHAIDRAGQHFLTDGAGRDGIAWAFPGAVFAPSEGARQTMPLISPGTYPKFAGLELIHSPHFPDDWQGTAVTCDFRAHRIVRFAIRDLDAEAAEGAEERRENRDQNTSAASANSANSALKKSGYVTQEMPDIARTADLAFRPIDVKLGPDGALYIADWTNPVINHGEVDFRDPRRDKQSGRIWRVSYKGRPTVKWEAVTTRESIENVTERSRSNSEWESAQALQNLHARDALIPCGLIPAFAKRFADPAPRERIFAMRTLALKPTSEISDKILTAAINAPADDAHYAFAAWRSVNDVADVWVQAVLAGGWKPEGREKQLEFALKAIEPALAGRVLAQLVSSGKAPLDGSGPWPELIGLAGGAKELRALLDSFTAGKVRPDAQARVLTAFVDATRNRNTRPEGDVKPAGELLRARLSEPAAVRLLGLWKLTDPMPEVAALAREGKTPQPVRNAAFDALKAYGDASAMRFLDEMTRPEFPLGLRRHALVTIAQVKLDAGLLKSREILRDIKNPDEALQTWRALLAIDRAPVAFAHRLPKDLPQPIYAAGLRAAREAGRKGQELVNVLTPLAGATVQSAPADYSDLAAQTLANGDPVAGEEIYRRTSLTCTVCHAIGGAGGKVGPELGTIGASAPLDYIIESMLDPGAKVKEGYNAVSLTQNDGNVSMGVVVRESAADIVIRTATGQEQKIAKEIIKQKDNLGSIMPPGLLEPLKPREKLNLYAFLAQLGKAGVYDASKGHIARTWWISGAMPNAKEPGVPLFTNVDGRLPRERLTESLAIFPNAPALFATAKLTAAAPTKTQLLLTGVREAWLDGKPLTVASEPSLAVELSQGDHTLVVKLDPKSLPEVLRVEAANVRFLTE